MTFEVVLFMTELRGDGEITPFFSLLGNVIAQFSERKYENIVCPNNSAPVIVIFAGMRTPLIHHSVHTPLKYRTKYGKAAINILLDFMYNFKSLKVVHGMNTKIIHIS